MAKSSSNQLWQLKITLNGIQPPIWRRIQVAKCTLAELHDHIQLAMGWQNAHLYQFTINGSLYSDPTFSDEVYPEIRDARVVKLSKFFNEGDKPSRFLYEYDLGDGWQHEVVFESCQRAEKKKRYPLCVDGARACPPEDVGGVYGFARYLEVIADPKHERHKELLAWSGPFDPEAFNAKTVTTRMRKGFPEPRLEDYI
jgi:hypothetical protein